jgi:hypothetical protein
VTESAPDSTSLVQPVPGSHYSAEEIERALMTLAYKSGAARSASRELKKQGLKIAPSTLRSWRDRLYVDRFLMIREEVIPAILREQRDEMSELISDQNHLERDLTAQLQRNRTSLDPKETSNALRNVTVSKGINVDKVSLADGRPTQITAPQFDLKDFVRVLEAEGFQVPETMKAAAAIEAEVVEETTDQAEG